MSTLTLTSSAEQTDQERAAATARAHDRKERFRLLVETSGFPFFGVAQWQGRRAVGGGGGQNGLVSDITVDHFDLSERIEPSVRVSSTRRLFDGSEEGALMVSRYGVVRQLTGNLFGVSGVHTDAMQSAYSDPELSMWDKVPITVDGHGVVARCLSVGTEAIAIVTHRGVVIGVHGHHGDLSGLALAEMREGDLLS